MNQFQQGFSRDQSLVGIIEMHNLRSVDPAHAGIALTFVNHERRNMRENLTVLS
jgi:hypothetical protein